MKCAACLKSLVLWVGCQWNNEIGATGRRHQMIKSILLAGEAPQGSFGTQNWELPRDPAGVILQPGHQSCWLPGADCCLTLAKAAAVHLLFLGLSTGTQMQQAAGCQRGLLKPAVAA